MILRVINKAINYFSIWYFFRKKQNCKVLFFKAPPAIVYSYLDYNVVEYVSNLIDYAQTIKIEDVDKLLSKSSYIQFVDNNLFDARQLLKLGWLINQLSKKPATNPIQIIKSSDSKYLCEPGSVRTAVSSYILPNYPIYGLYLWYPELDQHPFVLDYDYKEITTPNEFINQFQSIDSLIIRTANLHEKLDTSDKGLINLFTSNARYNTAIKSFSNIKDRYSYQFITFADNSHWTAIDQNIFLKDIISFPNSDTCILAGIKFTKKQNFWIKDD
jgi:hypothetical protein